MDKERRQILYRNDLRLYDVICTIVHDCIMNEARHYGVPEERAKRIAITALRRIVRKISHTWGPCICMVPSYKKIRKWDIYREGLTRNKKDLARNTISAFPIFSTSWQNAPRNDNSTLVCRGIFCRGISGFLRHEKKEKPALCFSFFLESYFRSKFVDTIFCIFCDFCQVF